MPTHPTTGEVGHVRYRLQRIGDTEAKLSTAKITSFWEETQAEVEADVGSSYNSGNALWRGCICDGVAVMCIADFIVRLMNARSRRLGDFWVEEQGLNWNVGIFEAAKQQYNDRFDRRIQLLSTGKYKIINTGSGSAPSTIGTSLDIIQIGV